MLLPRLIGPGRQCSLPADFILLSLIFWVCILCKLRDPSDYLASQKEGYLGDEFIISSPEMLVSCQAEIRDLEAFTKLYE